MHLIRYPGTYLHIAAAYPLKPLECLVYRCSILLRTHNIALKQDSGFVSLRHPWGSRGHAASGMWIRVNKRLGTACEVEWQKEEETLNPTRTHSATRDHELSMRTESLSIRMDGVLHRYCYSCHRDAGDILITRVQQCNMPEVVHTWPCPGDSRWHSVILILFSYC